jgi:protein-S-isoprenylcysteine O-methyltransferase Ste14
MSQPFEMNPFSGQTPSAARATVVNRTHRVVREQALEMRANRSRTRSLWIPIGIFSVLISIIFVAVWFVVDTYDITPNGVPDASDQMMVWTMWLAPVTILMFGLVWFQRQRKKDDASR